MIDYIKIGRNVELLFIGSHWCSMNYQVRLSVQEGFRQQFVLEKDKLFIRN